MKHKFPKEYYTIEKVNGVTDKVVNGFRSAIRHEMYADRKEQQLCSFSYGYIKDVEYLSSTYSEELFPNEIKNEALDLALQEFREVNEKWYDAVIDYYFSDKEMTKQELAAKHNVTQQEIGRRIKRGIKYLRKIMLSG